MKSQKYFYKLFFSFLIVILSFYFLFSNFVLAQTNLPLIVYPARQFLELNPGEKTSIVVNFINQAKEPISGYVKVVDFIVRDSQGTPELIENTFEAPEKYAASSWFKTDLDRVTLPANNEKVTIQTQISVPKNANPGGKYVAIYFQAQPSQFNNASTNNQYEAGTGIAPRLASLIYIKVKGPIKESAFVTKFKSKQSFFEYGPIEVETEILNQGNYHIAPKGEITLTNMLGKVVDKSLLKETNIFPETTRTSSNYLGKKWMIGKYRLSLAATYGEKNNVLNAFYEVWVFPWKIATIIILTLIIVILIIRHFYISYLIKEKMLEQELKKEREEIEELKKALKKKNE